ncbi:MAG: HEAT repeat domain-containing protein [Nitrospinota bacterium]|nr:HEAT repeat domain-containing protein [Nitrospinota bacterium]
MKKLIILILLFSSPAFAIEKDVNLDTCQSPKDCIAKLYKVLDRSRSPGQYPSLKEQAIIKKLLELGEDAMPFIVQLLEEDDELIASIGAVALREATSIDKKYLPQIVKGLNKDVSWLAPALAKIGTPEAAEVAVKKFLVSKSAPHNQENYALILFGKRALPAIIKAAKCEFGCNDKTHYLLGYALGEMEQNREDAAQLLIKVAEDSSLSAEVRKGALYMISFLDKPGLAIEDNLLRIRENETSLKNAANHALIGIKSKHSGKIYADVLANGGDKLVLRDIAELGTSGNEAGVAIIDLLDSDDMEKRLMAARTLGFIKYTPATSKLIQLLNEPSDVQLNWVAAESLGRMKSEIAIPALHNAALSHWYPPVKEAAKNAIEHIKSGKVYKSKFHKNNFSFEYFNYQNFGMKSCKNISLEAKPEPKDQKLYKSYAKEKLESLAYQSVIIGYGAKDEEQQIAEDPDGVIEVNESNIVEHRQEIKQVPHVALRVEGGWLAGSNRGEWGGELVYIPDKGKTISVLNKNIEDIYKFGDKYITTTGLAHLSSNNGMVYELFQGKDGYWQEKEWLKLPGSPISSRFVETGEILINTSGGGSILLSKNGSMQMATCN